jgi:hypothetical protein
VKRNVLFKALIRFTAESEQLRRVDQVPHVAIEEAQQVPPATDAPSRKTK